MSPTDSIEKDVLPSQLERQLERSSLFTHTALGKQAERINEVESFLYGLIDVLVKKGVTLPEELTRAVEDVRKELYEKGEHAHTGLGIRIDDQLNDEKFIPVNCNERLPICKAACCKLSFALTVEEIEAGVIKWDLGKPYFIRQEAAGYCTHMDGKTNCCSVYEGRPPVCRKYSCSGDKRIWKDFEKMELNEDWISQNLGENSPRLITAWMHSPGETINPT